MNIYESYHMNIYELCDMNIYESYCMNIYESYVINIYESYVYKLTYHPLLGPHAKKCHSKESTFYCLNWDLHVGLYKHQIKITIKIYGMSTHRHRMPSHCSLPAHQVECVGRILKTQLTDLQQGKKPSLTYDLHHTRLNTAINVFK